MSNLFHVAGARRRQDAGAGRGRRARRAPDLGAHRRYRRTARHRHVRRHVPGADSDGLRPVHHPVLHGHVDRAVPADQQERAAELLGLVLRLHRADRRGGQRPQGPRGRVSFGIMVTGILLALVGVLVHYAGAKWIDIIMPPVVNGAIVAIIGFNLAPCVWTNFQGRARHRHWSPSLAVLLVAVLFKGSAGPPQHPGRRDHRLCVRLLPWPGRLLRHRRGRMDRPAGSSACRRPTSPSCRCSSPSCSCSWPRTSATSSPWPR